MGYSERPRGRNREGSRQVGQSKKERACPLVDNGLLDHRAARLLQFFTFSVILIKPSQRKQSYGNRRDGCDIQQLPSQEQKLKSIEQEHPDLVSLEGQALF